MRNVIVIGSGPAGHTACIYLARANLSPLMIEGSYDGGTHIPGGQLMTTTIVENYPGFPDGIDGYDLIERFRQQSLQAGTEIVSDVVTQIVIQKSSSFSSASHRPTFVLTTKQGKVYRTHAVLVATGSTPRHLDVPGYETFWNRGVSTCAVCDGSLPRYKKHPVVVVGGGDSACEEALYMAKLASRVYLVHRRDRLRASSVMVRRVLEHPRIEMVWNAEVEAILGNSKGVTQVRIRTLGASSPQTLKARGVFVAIGHRPNTGWCKDIVACDTDGYIRTNPRTLQTNVEGIWAAGDVQDKQYRQAITAAGTGCQAALEIERWLTLLGNPL